MALPEQLSAHRLRFPGTLEGFAEAAEALQRVLDTQQLAARTRFNVELVFEEVSVNIVRYGSPTMDVHVAIDLRDTDVVLTFEDDGVPFNPIERPDPSQPDSLDDAKVGGLGIMLVKHFSARTDYERSADHNRLTVVIPTS